MPTNILFYIKLSYLKAQGAASLDEVSEFIKTSGIVNIDLAGEDVQQLIDALTYDGKLEKVMARSSGLGGAISYTVSGGGT